VIVDAIDSMDIEPSDGLRALHLMQTTGAKLISMAELLAEDEAGTLVPEQEQP
jgi:hypothetical protein